MTLAAAALSILVVILVAGAALEDADTGRVTIRRAQRITAVAFVGFGAISALSGTWDRLLTASLGVVVIAGIQAIPYVLQSQGEGRDWIGKADVRLGVPFGWTLGWFGVGVAVAGFAVSLAGGVLFSLAARRQRVPFVPFLALGLACGVAWGVLRLATGKA
ncbi:MAG: hypothetical protein ACR2QO_00890 [Acidimicrobiales bacterium]